MATPSIQIERLASALAASGGLKLWSVIVTVLGDLSVSKAAEISGRDLSRVIERMGLQPQAMRVALHRLKRDGWLETRREGRVVFYRLTSEALARSLAVREHIYSGPVALDAPVRLAVFPYGEARALAELPDEVMTLTLAPRVALVAAPLDSYPDDWLISDPQTDLPGWVRDELQAAACSDQFAALENELAKLDPVAGMDDVDRYALRTLVLHGWRRLVLRANPLSEQMLGQEAAITTCRLRVEALLAQLERPVWAEVSE